MKPGGRDRFVDLLRGGSIVAVVVGHWLVADVRWTQGSLADTSTLVEVPSMWPVTWLFLVIPLFFFVGGYANRRSWAGTLRRGEGYATYVDRRAHRMLAPTVLYLVAVALAGTLVDTAGGLGVRELGGLFYQPLWFLGAYLWVVALTPLTLRAHAHHGTRVLAVLAALVVLGDVGRFAFGISATGYLNVLWVWLLMHQLGYFYSDGLLTRRVATAMAVAGVAATAALVALGPYPGTMVAVPGSSEGNMHPPTLAVTTLGIAQIGICVLLREPLSRWLERPHVWTAVIALNLNILSIYLWHQAALTIAARLVLPLGHPDPTPGSPGWWLAHMLWLLVPGVTLAAIVAVVGRAERVPAPPPIRRGAATATLAALGVVLVGVAFIDLSGSSAMDVLAAGETLGPFTATGVLGLGLVAVSAVLFWLLRTLAGAAPGAAPPTGTPLRRSA